MAQQGRRIPDRGNTTARGYGRAHQKLRAEVKKVVDRGEGYCWRCGTWLDPTQPWDLGHDDHDRSIYRGPECRPCNRATSGRKAGKTQPRRWTLTHAPRSRARQCEICGTDYRASHAEQRTCGRACGRELVRRNSPASTTTPKRSTPPSGEQLTFPACVVCGAYSHRTTCSADCRRARSRNAYRELVGIPLDAPLWSRAA